MLVQSGAFLHASLAIAILVVGHAQAATDIIGQSGVKGGLVVVVGYDDPETLAELGDNESYLVQGLIADETKLQSAREFLHSKGIYGAVSVTKWTGNHLPYADNLVNLLIAEDPGEVGREEMMRVLAPLGVLMTRRDGRWMREGKPWPDEMDQWTHFLHEPDNNAVSSDRNINLPRTLQWVAGRRWNRTHEELSSISAAVTANGRLFYIEDVAPPADIRYPPQWKLTARDAFNGILLWQKDIDVWADHMRHFRAGPSHLARRLVAVGDVVYVALGLNAPLVSLNAATGKVIKTYKGTEWTEEILLHEGVLYLLVGTSEAIRSGEGLAEREEPKATKTRFLVALEEKSGKELWRRNAKGEEYILPLGVALKEDRLYHHGVRGLTCLEAKTGKQRWFVARGTSARRYAGSTSTLVATPEVILLADQGSGAKSENPGETDWTVHGWSMRSFNRTPKCSLTAYAADDGKKLWTVPCEEGFYVPVDVLVSGGLVWTGPFHRKVSQKQGYDLKTGKVKRTINIKGQAVGMVHDRCYRNKAVDGTIFTCRDGIEVIDMEKGWVRNNSWVRGPCQLGVMPANGLMYVPPDPCACHLTSRLQGYVALSSRRHASVGKPIREEGHLWKGPAYPKPLGKDAGSNAWPMYRNDSTRGGFSDGVVSDSPEIKWTADPGGRLTQAVSAWSKVFVASIDAHTVHALEADTGKRAWTFVADGRIDSAPTLYKGRVLFGTRGGSVYNLDAETGELAWRFSAAPERSDICVDGQVESVWPVHGAVLVQNDELHFTAGRSTYLAGGIYFYRLDPLSGKTLASNVITHIDPETEKQITAPETKFNSEGAVSDVLSGYDDFVFLNYLTLDRDGREREEKKPHLFSPTGILGEEWFVRSYWMVGTAHKGAGYTGWTLSSDAFPSGRILCFNENRFFGYGRRKLLPNKSGHRANSYRLVSSARNVLARPPAGEETVRPSAVGDELKEGRSKRRTRKKQGGGGGSGWSKSIPFTVRAMAGTPDRLVIAGVPSKTAQGPGERHIISFADPSAARDAFQGRLGSFLRILSATKDNQICEVRLPAMPVFDGTSIADGRIYVSLKDGRLLCLE